ncbi:hypothetical protein LOK49_LG10G00255 [Camellia lanceoleosa]|uniref:Uncharacterized protein n=1 Tax=Camellia lanceoleosa TaxID=1840588 RepID=A0ACC0G7C8_9ERIC|nr:hypothetical protein LOK49_LG10G00255 [Camellia lanceoleosa]
MAIAMIISSANERKRLVKSTSNLRLLRRSALWSFRRRVAYANARYDHLVGWSTSSLQRRTSKSVKN